MQGKSNLYFVLLKELHRKDGECLKCGKWITNVTFRGSLCQKCNEEYNKFEEEKDLEYIRKHPDGTILDLNLGNQIFLEFVRGSEVFVLS